MFSPLPVAPHHTPTAGEWRAYLEGSGDVAESLTQVLLSCEGHVCSLNNEWLNEWSATLYLPYMDSPQIF